MHAVKINCSIYLFVLCLCGILLSCSARKNYNTLSLFFDGVPNPDDIVGSTYYENPGITTDTISGSTDSTDIIIRTITYHEPYQSKGCEFCHDINSVGRMIIDEPDLCYQCHEDFSDLYSFTHGPVEGGFCTECHNPHSSKENNLLNDKVNNLCFYCHNIGELSEFDMHREGDDFLCTDCHNPHGGESTLMFIE